MIFQAGEGKTKNRLLLISFFSPGLPASPPTPATDPATGGRARTPAGVPAEGQLLAKSRPSDIYQQPMAAI
jgi:hypothetical protein